MFCLTKPIAEKLKQAVKNGSFSYEKLKGLKSSQEARDYLAEFVGKENAKDVNLLYEKKLLLKNQEKAEMDFWREVLGDKKFLEQKEKLAEQARLRVEKRQERLYDPKENERMLDEIASEAYSKKYGTDVSLEQAQTITELAQETSQAKKKITEGYIGNPDIKELAPEAIEYGARKVAMDNYVSALEKNINERKLINPLKEKGVVPKLEAIIENAKISVNFIADATRKLQAGILDNSFWGNQGAALLLDPKYTHIWRKNLVKSITDIKDTLKGGVDKGEAIVDAAKAMTYAEPLYLDGTFENRGGRRLDIWKGEEEIPSVLLKKIPLVGRLEKAADVAYEVGAVRARVDTAKQMYKMYKDAGIDITSKEVRNGINTIINSKTGRGNIGRLESSSKLINTIFFSVKLFKSTWDVMTAHLFDTKIDPKFKAEAGKGLGRILAVTALTYALAEGLGRAFGQKDTTELNPLSSDFTKIKVGDTRISIPLVTRMASLITLISRIASQKSKSTTTGITKKLGEGYGADTGMDVFWQFVENKFSPLFNILSDLASQKTFEGKKPTLLSETKNSITPMGLSNAIEIWKDPSTNAFIKALATTLSYFGTNVQSYKVDQDWSQSTSKELTEFKAKVGEEKFKEANQKYNDIVNKLLVELKKMEEYRDLPDETKSSLITKLKDKAKKTILNSY